MEVCSLCGTTINQGAVACSGCGAIKEKHMTRDEATSWKLCTIVLFGIGAMLGGSAVFILPIIAIVGFLYRYATRKEYWRKSI